MPPSPFDPEIRQINIAVSGRRLSSNGQREIEHNSVLARRERIRSLPVESRQIEEVVGDGVRSARYRGVRQALAIAPAVPRIGDRCRIEG